MSDNKLFNRINKSGDWIGELKKMEKYDARIFNHKIAAKLSKIIKLSLRVK